MLASRAYDKAAQLDPKNTTAPTKLRLVRELFSVKAPPVEAAPGANR